MTGQRLPCTRYAERRGARHSLQDARLETEATVRRPGIAAYGSTANRAGQRPPAGACSPEEQKERAVRIFPTRTDDVRVVDPSKTPRRSSTMVEHTAHYALSTEVDLPYEQAVELTP